MPKKKLFELPEYQDGWNALNINSETGIVTIINLANRTRYIVKVKNLGQPNEQVVSVKKETGW